MLFKTVVAALTITILTALQICLAQDTAGSTTTNPDVSGLVGDSGGSSEFQKPQAESQPETQPATQPVAEVKPVELTARQREKVAALWKTLLNEDGETSEEELGKARRAMLDEADLSIAFLTEEFARSTLDKETAAKLIADLDSDAWRKREAATRKLKSEGLPLADMVLAGIESSESLETRSRLDEISKALGRRVGTAMEILISINSDASWAAVHRIIASDENADNAKFMAGTVKTFMSNIEEAVDMFLDNRFYYISRSDDYNYEISAKEQRLVTFVRSLSVEINSRQNALTLSDIAVRLSPDNPKCYTSRGWLRLHFNRGDEAYADLTRATELAPKDPESFLNRGQMCIELNRLDDALADFTRALDLSPEDPQLYIWRGRAYLKLDKKEDAISDFTEAIRLKPEQWNYYAERAEVYDMLGKADEAMADIDMGIKHAEDDSQRSWMYCLRASQHRKLEHLDKYIEDMKKGIELYPNTNNSYYAELCNNFAWFYVTCEDPKYRDPKAAIDYAERSCALVRRNPAPLDTLGCAYADDGQWEKAIETQQKAVEYEQDADRKKEFTERLEGFKNHKTYLQQEAEKKKKAEPPAAEPPAAQDGAEPATQGETQPATRPAAQPETQPDTQPQPAPEPVAPEAVG